MRPERGRAVGGTKSIAVFKVYATSRRHARPCAGHPRRADGAAFERFSRRHRVGGRDKPGHDEHGLHKSGILMRHRRGSVFPDSHASTGGREIMLTGDLRSKIDAVWNAFWAGGIANPLEVIEQITYLLFMRGLDEAHTREENKAT